MKPAWKPLLFGVIVAFAIIALFRLAGTAFFVEGRSAANLHAAGGALAGALLGFAVARLCCGLRGVLLSALPGMLLMAAVASHFSLAFPALPPALDKGFGGLMLWFYGFWLLGGTIACRSSTITCA
jgi:Family of unknown function (DUF5367)